MFNLDGYKLFCQRNQCCAYGGFIIYILDGDLSDRTSLIHLLDKNDSEDNNEAHVIKHSPYYGETDFSKLLLYKAGFNIRSLNIQSVNAKFDEFQLFVNRMNPTDPISVICL